MMTGLIKKPFTMPTQDEAEDQPAQTMEEALRKKREKLAQDKLHLGPEASNEV